MIKNLSINLLIVFLFCFYCGQTQTNNKIKKDKFDTITTYHIMTPLLKCNGIPDSVFKMINLKYLSVIGEDCDVVEYDNNGNQIHKCCGLGKLSFRIGQLTNLEGLYLQLNGLDSLPQEILLCSKIKVINLTDNNISNIDNIVKLKNLEVLFLYGCWLTKLPGNISEMKNLRELGLTGNKLDKGEFERIKKALPNCRIVYEP
jgi:hypothetical protein